MKKKFFIFFFFLFFPLTVNALQIKNIYWEPKEPKEGDTITVYAEVEGNASLVKLEYCIGGACYPVNMEKIGNLWKGSFKAKKGEINITIMAKEDNNTIYEERKIYVKEKKMPSLELIVILFAIAIAIKMKKS